MSSIKKDLVLAELKKILADLRDKDVNSDAIKNLLVFGNEIEIDLIIKNPTLQYKKKVEDVITKSLIEIFTDCGKIKINFNILKKDDLPKIKGDQIPGVKNIFAIASGKGGVGKSTVTANIAVALSELGYKVGVIDADIYGPSMHLMFDLVDAVPRAVEVEGKRRMSPPENYGVKVLSIGFFTDAQQAVVWRGPMASKALNQLLWDAHWGEIDYLLVDLPPGTGDIHLSLVQSIPLTGAVVVSTPQDIALADVKKGVNMFQMPSIDVPVIGLIENMSYFSPEELPENKYYIFGKSGVKNLSEKMNIEFLGEIPIVQSVREAADAGRPAVLQDNTPISNTFMNLASKIDHQIKKRNVNLPPTKKVDITHKKGCS